MYIIIIIIIIIIIATNMHTTRNTFVTFAFSSSVLEWLEIAKKTMRRILKIPPHPKNFHRIFFTERVCSKFADKSFYFITVCEKIAAENEIGAAARFVLISVSL